MNDALLSTFSDSSRKTVIKDYKLPIPVYKDINAWLYFCNLYNVKYKIDSIAQSYYDMGQMFNFEDKAILKERQDFIDKMLRQLTSLEVVRNTKLIVPDFPEGTISESLYDEKNDKKICISIKIDSPDFSIMTKYYPDNTKNSKTYNEMASWFTRCNYLKDSILLKEKIFEKIVGSKFSNIIKKEYVQLITFLKEDIKNIFDVSFDDKNELNLIFKDFVKFNDKILIYNNLKEKLEQYEKISNIKYKIDYFLLIQVTDTKYFIKEKEHDEFEIINCPVCHMAQVLKMYKKLSLDKYDLMFTFESKEAIFTEPLFSVFRMQTNNIFERMEIFDKVKKQTEQKPKEQTKTKEQVLDEIMRKAGLEPERFYDPSKDSEMSEPPQTSYYDPNKDVEKTDKYHDEIEKNLVNSNYIISNQNKTDDPFANEMKKRIEDAFKEEEEDNKKQISTLNLSIEDNTLNILSSIDKWNNQ